MNRKERIELLFGNRSILDAVISSRNRMAFITREVQYFTEEELVGDELCLR